MANPVLTTQEITKTLKELWQRQTDLLLLNLDASEHILALKTTLLALDSRAASIFEEQLARAHVKNETQREELRKLLETM